jgi:hypothetical protein
MKVPNARRTKKYFDKKKKSFLTVAYETNSQSQPLNEAHEISRLQKELNDQITRSVWEEKERIRIKERIKHLQSRGQTSKQHFTCIKRACVAIGTGGPSTGEVSVTDSELELDATKEKGSQDIIFVKIPRHPTI